MSDPLESDKDEDGLAVTIAGKHEGSPSSSENTSAGLNGEHAMSNGQHHGTGQLAAPASLVESATANGVVRERVTVAAPAGQRRRRPGQRSPEQSAVEPEPTPEPEEPPVPVEPSAPPPSRALPGQRARRTSAALPQAKPRPLVIYGFPKDDVADRWVAAGFVSPNDSFSAPDAPAGEEHVPTSLGTGDLAIAKSEALSQPGVQVAPVEGESSVHSAEPPATIGVTAETVVANFAPAQSADSAAHADAQTALSHDQSGASSVTTGVETPPEVADLPYTPPAAYTYVEPQSSALSLVEGSPANLAAAVTAPPAVPPAGTAVGAPAPVPSEDDEEEEGGSMTIIEHLEELRRRLIWIVVAIAIGAFAGWFLTVPAIQRIEEPLVKAGIHLISLTVFGGFMLQIKMAFVLGTCLAMPMILYQVWGFVAPGLTRREKRYARPFVLLGSLLFIAGAATGFFIFPLGIAFALQFFPNLGILPTPEADKYVTFVGIIMVLFGLTFELPVFNVFLALIGIISSQGLARRRKAAILIIFALAMVITPGADLVSPIILGVILCALYESSIWLSKAVGR
jgi:sec-independent protein translocase protein TatC